MRRGAELLQEQNVLAFDGTLRLALAEAEARAGDRSAPSPSSTKRSRHPTGPEVARFDAELHRAARRNAAEARSRQLRCARRGSAPDRHRRRETARRAQLRIARGAVAGQALPIDRPPLDAHAVLAPALEGLFADAGNAGDRRGAGAARGAGGDGRGQGGMRRSASSGYACTSPMAMRCSPRAASARRKRRKPSPEPASPRPATKMRPNGWRPTTALWVGSFIRGELSSMRACAEDFLGDVEARPDSPEAGIAHRSCGVTYHCAGEYVEARDHLERALDLFHPGQDDDLAFRFGLDAGIAAMACLALALWPLGEVDRAASLIERMLARIASLAHVTTLAIGRQLRGAIRNVVRRPEAREGERTGVREIGPRARSQPVQSLSQCFSKDGRGPRTT